MTLGSKHLITSFTNTLTSFTSPGLDRGAHTNDGLACILAMRLLRRAAGSCVCIRQPTYFMKRNKTTTLDLHHVMHNRHDSCSVCRSSTYFSATFPDETLLSSLDRRDNVCSGAVLWSYVHNLATKYCLLWTIIFSLISSLHHCIISVRVIIWLSFADSFTTEYLMTGAPNDK